MPLHPDAPPEVRTDAERYARWRLEHLDEEERLACAAWLADDAERLAYFKDEFYEAMDGPEDVEVEDAEIELHLLAEKGIKPN